MRKYKDGNRGVNHMLELSDKDHRAAFIKALKQLKLFWNKWKHRKSQQIKYQKEAKWKLLNWVIQ